MLKSDFSLDKSLGLRYFITDTPGIGGRLRESPEDFIVSEIPVEKIQDEDGEYTYFTLEKAGWDTIRAIKVLARTIGVSKKRLGFAGTKDKKALTRQRMAAWNVSPERLKAVNIKDMRLFDFSRSSERLLVGDLLGNRFDIIVRDPVVVDEEVVGTCTGQIGERGIPNYFGYQRFGVMRPNTHLIGEFLIRGDVEGAVMSYLADYFEGEREDARSARKELGETMDFRKALNSFPRRLGYERTMIDHLANHPTDFAGALRRLHKKLRQMFIHGYQSYLFNLILNRMIEENLDIKKGSIPLLGYESVHSPGRLGEIEREVLEEAGTDLEDFKIQRLPELSSRGSVRRASMEVDVGFESLGDSSFLFTFSLPKGNYATMVMREIMKADPLCY